jgi:hypothetical protein
MHYLRRPLKVGKKVTRYLIRNADGSLSNSIY